MVLDDLQVPKEFAEERKKRCVYFTHVFINDLCCGNTTILMWEDISEYYLWNIIIIYYSVLEIQKI